MVDCGSVTLDHICHRLAMERGDKVMPSQQPKLAEDHQPQQQRLPELMPPSTTTTTSEAPELSLSNFYSVSGAPVPIPVPLEHNNPVAERGSVRSVKPQRLDI